MVLPLLATILGASAGAAAPLPAACAQALDGFCGNITDWPGGDECFNSVKKRHPSFTRFYAACTAPGKEWRCYSPYSLASGSKTADTPIMQRKYSTGPDFCTPSHHAGDNGLADIFYAAPCPGVRPPPPPPAEPDNHTLVFPTHGSDIPSLAYVPPGAPGAHATMGTLVAFKQQRAIGEPWARTSTDHGKTWLAKTNPAEQAGLPAAAGRHSVYCCSQSVYDGRTQSIVLQFGNSTGMKGGCDLGEEALGGVLQLRSTDAGKTFGDFENVQQQIERRLPVPPSRPGSPPGSCLAPTSGQGTVMRPVDGKYGGRLVFCAVQNAYQGDVPVWSDDGGKTFSFSTGVYIKGLDECSIAQATNGSLMLVARNCFNANYRTCGMRRRRRLARGLARPNDHVRANGNKFLAASWSHDGIS
jgi:hypothetical protein